MSSARGTVILVHNRYRNRGGEDAMVKAEIAMLADGPWSVVPMISDSPPNAGKFAESAVGLSAIWSRTGYARMRDTIAETGADLVHIHNLWPTPSPAVIRAARAARVPIVMTLHNYRLLCPAATLLRDGRPCEACVGRTLAWPGIAHACYRGKHAASAIVAATTGGHRLARTWHAVDRFIALTHFSRDVFIRGGLPADRITVKPNFSFDGPPAKHRGRRGGGLFVGRLSIEKGIGVLARAAQGLRAPLRVLGDGPMRPYLDHLAAAGDAVLLGEKSHACVLDEMDKSEFLVLPSIGYENFPVTVIEALGRALPVITSAIGALGEIVEDGETGLLVTPGDADELAAKMRWAENHPEEMRRMGANARRRYLERYTPERNRQALYTIYETVLGKRRAKSSGMR
jgi:glycosyltransferase involved in cell wall biosynthesis